MTEWAPQRRSPPRPGSVKIRTSGVVDTQKEEEEYSASLDKYRNTSYSQSARLSPSISTMRVAPLAKSFSVSAVSRPSDVNFVSSNTQGQPKAAFARGTSVSEESIGVASSHEGSVYTSNEKAEIEPKAADEKNGIQTSDIPSTPQNGFTEAKEEHGSRVLDDDHNMFAGPPQDSPNENDGEFYLRDYEFDAPPEEVADDDQLQDGNEDDTLFGDYSFLGQLSQSNSDLGKIPLELTGLGFAFDDLGGSSDSYGSLKHNAGAPIGYQFSPARTRPTATDSQMSLEEGEFPPTKGQSLERPKAVQSKGVLADQKQNIPPPSVWSTKVFGFIRLDVLTVILCILVALALNGAVAAGAIRASQSTVDVVPPNTTKGPPTRAPSPIIRNPTAAPTPAPQLRTMSPSRFDPPANVTIGSNTPTNVTINVTTGSNITAEVTSNVTTGSNTTTNVTTGSNTTTNVTTGFNTTTNATTGSNTTANVTTGSNTTANVTTGSNTTTNVTTNVTTGSNTTTNVTTNVTTGSNTSSNITSGSNTSTNVTSNATTASDGTRILFGFFRSVLWF